jgi:hypothetical protein
MPKSIYRLSLRKLTLRVSLLLDSAGCFTANRDAKASLLEAQRKSESLSPIRVQLDGLALSRRRPR